MVDEYPSTDESDIDAFLEYARDMIAENDISYESTSFQDFENLLQDCVANHFLDHNIDDDEDSMASESSFSGYVNEGCYSGTRQKSALLTKRGIMSDNAYHRMKGIIAQKKKAPSNDTMQFILSQDKGTTMTTENNDITSHSFENQFESDTTISEDSFIECFPSRIYDMTTSPTSKVSEKKLLMNNSIKHESDSSDSILDNILPRQTRQRKCRRRTKNKKMLRGESITPDGISENLDHAIDQKVSILLSNPRSKEKAFHFTSEQAPSRKDSEVARLGLTHDKYTHGLQPCAHLKQQSYQDKSDTTGRSSNGISLELCIDTTNSILPSLVKKGIKYYDIPEIERTLARMARKIHTMNRKQKVLDQLLERCALQINEAGITQKGMALVHKMRAERKMALQATYLRYSIQRRDDSEGPRLATPTDMRDDNSKILKTADHQQEVIVPTSQQHNFLQSPSSLSSYSSIEEKNRFKIFIGKTKRTLSNSKNRDDKKGLLHNQYNDQFRMSSSYSSPDEAALMPKTSPFEKMIFSCSKESLHYETLSPSSSLTNDTSWNDSGDFSMIRSTDSINQDEIQMQSSDCSEWSDMSFLSDQNRVAESVSPEKVDTNFASYRSQTNSHQIVRLPLTPLIELKPFDDSFDEIVLRNKPNPVDKNFSNRLGDESPTGVIDFFSELQNQHEEKAGDALAFVDDDEGDHVFTDKEDSFVMKSTEQIMCASPMYQPVFLSPSRFEI